MSQKRKRSQVLPSDGEPYGDSVFRSAPIEDRSSTFIGLYSPSVKPKDLQKLEEIASASHKILAWRRESNQQAITGGVKYTMDSDDDGEKYGGKKIAKVLDKMQVAGACVVARWYGGILLGPVRFEHIEKCAVEAVKKWQQSVAEERSKKRKLEEETAEKVKLVKVLADRDQSISVLRTLAAEKEEKVRITKSGSKKEDGDNKSSQSNGDGPQQSQIATLEARPTIDYSVMTLERLKVLERARDATLSFLLKRIDKAEAHIASNNGNG